MEANIFQTIIDNAEIKIRSFSDEEGKAWFVGSDVATALGYRNVRDALKVHVDQEDKNTVVIRYGIHGEPSRGNPNKTCINESGLYALILGSKLPSAKAFKRWVTSEVLPSLRQKGSYSMLESRFNIPQTLPDALRLAADLGDKLEEQRPAVEFANHIVSNDSEFSVGEAAQKVHEQTGIDIGRNRLMAKMRNYGWVTKVKTHADGVKANRAMQSALEAGYITFKPREFSANNNRKVHITGLGLCRLIEMIKSENYPINYEFNI